ncbi:putative dolichyl-diphosphooligosaccharide--protein glycosyltransferase subunit 3B, partial [Cucurbita argyrosperma subsp. argyrosperma]|uniref:Probable dolichyl-diphosphooligosaccharide--protein glycosyltransferase subunit 3B n=2 Tax=Cucurbita TaxID=3660 RepID=A0A6J1GE54_CUCMO
MATFSSFPHSLLLALLLTVVAQNSVASSGPDLVAELLALQSRSDSGVIHLDDQSVSRFLSSPKSPRPYSLLIFFDALQLHDKSELHLKELRREFGLVSSSFITNNPDPSSSSRSKLFFCEIEFKESQPSFSLFGVNALPHVRLIGPNQTPKKSDQMDQSDYSRLAESMAEFVESKTSLVVGPIHRPPMFSKNQITFLVIAMLILAPFALKKIIAGETLLNDRKVWLIGAIFIYFFSVAGTMHNIIRKMPMFMTDRNDPSKLIFFYQGSGMQLGAEGFAVGFLYTIVGLLLAFITHVLVKVRNVNTQRVVMLVALFVSFWAVKKVVYLDNWKTGYGIHGYWPSSWN